MGQTMKDSETSAEHKNTHYPDPVALSKALAHVAEEIQPLLLDFYSQYAPEALGKMQDATHIQEAYYEFMAHLWDNPQRVLDMQMQFWQEWTALCQESASRFMGQEAKTLYEPEKGDRRFRNPAWKDSALFDFIKQSYLLTGKWMRESVNKAEGMDEDTYRKVDFYTRQFIDALSPSNFLFTNPEVLEETMETGGENLIRGFENLIEDLKRGQGELKIKTTDYDAFEVGKNLAITPGKVIYENELMQLIQYEPATEKVHKRPFLIVPPWINKYYILDLKPENSFIKWLIDQGHTVFTISWVNPDKKLARKSFDDYMRLGTLAAMDQVREITGEPDCNILGYCLGGTLTAITLAWLHEKGQQERVAAATFLTTLINFDRAGEMKLFIDDAQLEVMDKEMAEKGFLPAETLKNTFSMLRANDLIWSFVVNNYLMGREPFPFDLLYWNDDATNMPAAMHSFYLRKFYRENLLTKPGGVTINDETIDIASIKTPCYFLSTKEDHIAPWHATYDGMKLMGGKDVNFTLAASGHVAGVVNHPDKNKYCFWTGKPQDDADRWFETATSHDGSWWPHWEKWLRGYAGGEKVQARKIGGGKLKPIEEAPGRYVKMKA